MATGFSNKPAPKKKGAAPKKNGAAKNGKKQDPLSGIGNAGEAFMETLFLNSYGAPIADDD